MCWGFVIVTQQKSPEEWNRTCAAAFLLLVIKYLPMFLDDDLLDIAVLLAHDFNDVTSQCYLTRSDRPCSTVSLACQLALLAQVICRLLVVLSAPIRKKDFSLATKSL